MGMNPDDGDDGQHDSREKWSLRPPISAADVPRRLLPTVTLSQGRYYTLKDHGRRRVRNGAHGTFENHEIGILGEGAVAQYLGIETEVDTALHPDGDGGVDLRYRGVTLDVKTASRCQSDPSLTVGAHQPLRADWYVLVHRVGETTFRLIGFAPRKFVANAPQWERDGRKFHLVPQEDLFPFTPYHAS